MWSAVNGPVVVLGMALVALGFVAVALRSRPTPPTCRTRGLKCLLPRRARRAHHVAGAQAACTECGRVWTYQRVAFRDGQLKAVWTSPRKS